MNTIHIAPLAYEAGGVQRLLRGVAIRRDEPIFNMSATIDDRFIQHAGKPKVIPVPGWLKKLSLARSLSLRRHARRHKNAVVWDDIRTWRRVAKHRQEPILYDHSISLRNHGSEESRDIWRRVRYIVTCSNAQAEHIRRTWTTEAQIDVCLNGLPYGFAVPSERPVRPRICGRRIRIGMVARLSFEKGHGIMLHALQRLRADGVDAELVIVGAGALDTAISGLTEKLGLADVVTRLGYIDAPESVYGSLDLVCLPSLWEPFGLTAIEAEAFGCPVVVADRGGLSEAAGAGGIMIKPTLTLQAYRELAPGLASDQSRTRLGAKTAAGEPCALDPGDLAEAIARLVSCEATYQTLSANGFERVTGQFTFDAYMKRLGAILDRHTAAT
jgi:glycosyltransferase involved in cell wall biosynthesis